MRFQQAPYRIADVVALLFIAHGNTSFGSLAPIIPYRSCKHYLEDFAESSHLTKEEILIYLKELSKEAFKAEHFVL
ncbi:hypothetical protein, partial [Ruthenibacterium lactatiformans]|uniref:hypothetical protein n=1 Tax=Ruthenibacterium lactatiformans TaxID=1550024 RepID=UPI001A9B4B34